MRRRHVVAALGGAALAAARPAGAQQEPQMPVVGVLLPGTEGAEATQPLLEALQYGLAQMGFSDGRNVAFDLRWAGGRSELLPLLAGELVRRRAAVICTLSNVATLAARVAAPKVPIVFMFGLDPVKHGLVASIDRPGGNITGVSLLAGGLEARRLQLVRLLLPDVDLVAALVNPDNPDAASHARDLAAAARAWRLKMLTLEVRSDDDFEPALSNMMQQLAGALIVTSDPFFDSRRQQLVALIARTRMPTIYPWRDFVAAGGLMSYGPSPLAGARRVGLHAGRILRGVKPADLPVWVPSTFELVVNLATATAMRITIPPAILARADEVIE